MRWNGLWARGRGDSERRTNRKRNTVTSVGGRSAEMAGRRLSRAMTGLLLAALAASTVAAVWLAGRKLGEELLTANPEYRLEAIDIRSDGQRVSAAKVKQWAELETGMNMHGVDIAEKRRLLLQRVPVIKSVEIKRVMPDRLEVLISERLPIVCLGRSRALGADQTGYVFAIAPSSGATLPVIPDATAIRPGAPLQGKLLNAVEVVDVLNRTALGGLMRVEELDVRDPDCLSLRLTECPLVRLSWLNMAMSTPESRLNLEAKLRSLVRVLDDARLKKRKLTKVDMTFNDDYIPVE